MISIKWSKIDTKYLDETKEITGIIVDYKVTDKQVTMDVQGLEKVKVKHAIKDTEIKEKLCYGCKVLIRGEMQQIDNNTVPNNFNYREYLKKHKIYHMMKATEVIFLQGEVNFLYKIKNMVVKRVTKIDNSGYMKGFILGDKSEIEYYTKYQTLGIAHLFAISGMHIGLFSTFLLKILHKLGDKPKYLLVILFLLLYGFIVGFTPSIKRCLLFFILNCINKLFKLNLSLLKVFTLTISLLILFDVNLIYDVGFLYSVFTVGGIILNQAYINKGNYLVKSLKLSYIAFLFSLPIALHNFYAVNFLAIIYNLFYVPFVSLIMYPLCLLSFIISPLERIFLVLVFIFEKVSGRLVTFDFLTLYMKMPLFSMVLFYLCLILIFKLGRKKYYAGLIISILLFYGKIFLDANWYIYYFDVGQGDCALLISARQREVIMIDTGGLKSYDEASTYYVSDKIITFLHSRGIKKIDKVLLSHGDYDHMGDALNIIQKVKVTEVIFNCGEFNDLEKELIKVLDKKKIRYYLCIKELNIDNNKLYFLQTKEYDNENDNSNVIYTELNGYKFMFMGDAGIEKEKDILNKYKISNVDVLKVGHHGSKTSSSKTFINEINPKYSVISVGKNNRYGHPNREVLNNLEQSKIYRTDQDGSIMFKIKNNKLKIETYSP